MKFKKLLKQLLAYLIVEGLVVILISLTLSKFFNPVTRFDWLSIFTLAILVYQFICKAINPNNLDSKKDELSAYKRLVRKMNILLTKDITSDTESIILKELEKASYTYKNKGYMIEEDTLNNLKEHIDTIVNGSDFDKRILAERLELEIINIEQQMEFIELEWSKTLLLKHLK